MRSFYGLAEYLKILATHFLKCCLYNTRSADSDVDMNKSTRSFVDCQKDLDEIGAQIGVSIKCQKAEIFEKMHRI